MREPNTARASRSLRWVAAVVLLGAATATYAYTTDVDSGGRIDTISGGKLFTAQQRTDTVPGRAELRGSSSTTGFRRGDDSGWLAAEII